MLGRGGNSIVSRDPQTFPLHEKKKKRLPHVSLDPIDFTTGGGEIAGNNGSVTIFAANHSRGD